MIRLVYLLNEIVDPMVEFLSPDEVDYNYYKDLDKIEKSSGINILSDKEVSVLALYNGKVVGALYTSIQGNEYSFDIIVDKSMVFKGIGPRFVDIGLNEYKELKENGYILKLDVVNLNLEKYLLNKGLKVVEKIGNHSIMTY